MTLRNPASWMQNGSHTAENDRLSTQGFLTSTGILSSSSLAITQSLSPGMSVLIAQGWGAIVGDYTTNMGAYQFYNDAAATATITSANVSNPRIDKICITISDSYYIGALSQVAINVIAGTPSAVPVAPATPGNSILLATVLVGTAVSSILNANITDMRVTTNLAQVSDLIIQNVMGVYS